MIKVIDVADELVAVAGDEDRDMGEVVRASTALVKAMENYKGGMADARH